MTTARQIITSGTQSVNTKDSAAVAARLMGQLGVGALPLSGPDNKIKGVVTDRDLVVKVVAPGRDLGAFPVGDLNQNEAVTIEAGDDVDDVLATMPNHKVRRLPVINGDQLVGMISLADVAQALPNYEVGELVEALTPE